MFSVFIFFSRVFGAAAVMADESKIPRQETKKNGRKDYVQLDNLLKILDCPVGGSDLPLFMIFENWHIAANWVCFLLVKCLKLAKFSCSKNHKNLKNECFCTKFENILRLLQRTIAKQENLGKIFNKFILGLKNGQNCFWPGLRKKIVYLNFLLLKN